MYSEFHMSISQVAGWKRCRRTSWEGRMVVTWAQVVRVEMGRIDGLMVYPGPGLASWLMSCLRRVAFFSFLKHRCYKVMVWDILCALRHPSEMCISPLGTRVHGAGVSQVNRRHQRFHCLKDVRASAFCGLVVSPLLFWNAQPAPGEEMGRWLHVSLFPPSQQVLF